MPICMKLLSGLLNLCQKDKPRYLMGVGTPEDLIENIERRC